MTNKSAGARFRAAIEAEKPLQVMGTINAYSAMMAQRVGYQAIYLSGGGVANASYGLPDLGMTSMNDVLEDVRRITSASSVPLLVDIDTGWGGAFNISRTVREMIKAGAGGVHMEDQVAQKRCGHRPGKAIVSVAEMNDRLKAALDAKTDPDFIVMARTDALAVDGFDAVIERAQSFAEVGADAIFAEAMTDLTFVPAGRRCGGHPGAGQYHGVWSNPPVHHGRVGQRGRTHGVVPALRVSRDEPGGTQRLSGHSVRRYAEERTGHNADQDGSLRFSRLSRLRAEAR